MTDSDFLFLLIASTAIDLAAAGAVLVIARLRRPGETLRASITPWRVLQMLVAAGLVFLAKLPILHRLGLGIFGLIHLIYLDTAILLPLAGTALLLCKAPPNRGAGKRWTTIPIRAISVVAIAAAPVAAYARWIEPFRLQLETVRIPISTERSGRDPVRIGVLADIQTDRISDHEREAVAEMMKLSPDVIVLPGDLFQAFSREQATAALPAIRELLSGLSAPGGVYFVLGDVDESDFIRRAIRGTAVRLLENEIIQTQIGDRQLTIGGVELAFGRPAARRIIDRLQTEDGASDIRILLSHRPDAVLKLGSERRIDLVVAGHTHGGQVAIPLFGPPMTLTKVPRTAAAGGFHRINGEPIYISRGIGLERGQAPRIRFLCPPEISLLRLEATVPMSESGPDAVTFRISGESGASD